MSITTLSPQQHKALLFIADYIWAHGYQPLQAEVAEHLFVSPQTARKFIVQLEIKGYIYRAGKVIRLVHVPGFPQARQIGGKTAA